MIYRLFKGIVREYFVPLSDASLIDVGAYNDMMIESNIFSHELDCVLKLLDGSYKVSEVRTSGKDNA